MTAIRIAGEYDCSVKSTSHQIGTPPKDTSYYKTIEVVRKGKTLNIGNWEIPIDSVKNESYYYEPKSHGGRGIRFEKDSVFILMSGGGMGGGYLTTYKGIKK